MQTLVTITEFPINRNEAAEDETISGVPIQDDSNDGGALPERNPNNYRVLSGSNTNASDEITEVE